MGRKKNDKLKPNYSKIINAGTALASNIGLERISSINIARYMNVHHSLLFLYFPSVEAIKKAVVEKAIQDRNLYILLSAFLNKRISKEDIDEETLNDIKSLL